MAHSAKPGVWEVITYSSMGRVHSVKCIEGYEREAHAHAVRQPALCLPGTGVGAAARGRVVGIRRASK